MGSSAGGSEMHGTCPKSILAWYDGARPMWLDLVGDYAGKELFLIEGDSLLKECFEDERIDFKDIRFSIFIHLILLSRNSPRSKTNESQMDFNYYTPCTSSKSFSRISPKDTATFISHFSKVCIPSITSIPILRIAVAPDVNCLSFVIEKTSNYAFPQTRKPLTKVDIFLLGLQSNNIFNADYSNRILIFSSLDSEEFQDYLRTTPIHFVMAHDGTATTNKLVKVVLRGMIWFFNTHKLNVALINRIEFRDTKVFTMVVESLAPLLKDILTNADFAEQLEQARDRLTENLDSHGQTTVSLVEELPVDELVNAATNEQLNERSLLAAYATSRILEQDTTDPFIASAFILHTVALNRIPLSERRFPLALFDEDFENKITNFLASFARISTAVLESSEWHNLLTTYEIESNAIDIVDGRLLRMIMKSLCEESGNAFPEMMQHDWSLLRNLTRELSSCDLSLEESNDVKASKIPTEDRNAENQSDELTVLPFTSEVFDKHLQCIHIKTDTSLRTNMASMKLYRETTHWHKHKKPSITKAAPAPKYTRRFNPLRANQFYMREMTAYAASLTGATGKALEPETIFVGPKQLKLLVEAEPVKPGKPEKPASKSKDVEKNENKNPKAAKKGTKAAAGKLSLKEQIKAANLEKKGDTESDKAFASWSVIIQKLEEAIDDEARYLQAKQYLNKLDGPRAKILEADINTFILQSLLSWWASYCKNNKKKDGYFVVALIWATVRELCTTTAPITEPIVRHMQKVCKLLEITDALSAPKGPMVARKLSFSFWYPFSTSSLSIGMTQTEFQLDYCGPYMDRMLDAKPDARVSNFVPDGWQRDVLDQLDANKSVFVVAPTSAGKTFISFYAMEQVLRADNDGVLVYVAPTKALVNQIAAEIQGRFSKKYPQPGKGVWAIRTRDYRVNQPLGAQILVTVPHVLQTMLLSPSNAKSWAPRVKRIIFDEVHSIGQAEDGVVWEQLLLLAPCPIIALSATVGNPEQFNDWLAETQKASGHEIVMIKHSTRYSDLRKYMFEPPKSFRFKGLGDSYGSGLGLDGLEGFEPFHPISSLIDPSRGIPDDLALEPRDCLSLWKAMIKHQTEEYRVLDTLNPAKALPPCIRKADIFAWEKDLKTVLLKWMSDNSSPFTKVVAELTPEKTHIVQKELSDSSSSTSSTTSLEFVDPMDVEATTLPLLCQLHKRRALPAILFNYDWSSCESIAQTILKSLVEAETKWKQGPAWKRVLDDYEQYQENQRQEMKFLEAQKKIKKEVMKQMGVKKEDKPSKMNQIREEASREWSIWESFDPDAPQADFSFSDPKRLAKEELEEFIRQLRRKEINEDLIDLLKRGVGVHHAGMNRKYRQCVEMLFRKGFLRVVVATGTLSLGINMPCATVVFSGDSVYLTALNFRQAAGRSGRRGFDLLGNVVFQCISRERASRLLSTRLPDLTGHFPLTTTLVLRLFRLLNDSKKSPYAVKAINSLLSQPRLYLGGESFKEQVLHHLRFSIEYLRRNALLGPGGEPVNFTSCVSHLYFTENSSFAFHALLKGKYFHQLCENIDTNKENTLRTLMLVLSHLFGRRVVREVDDPEEAEKIRRSPSTVYLAPMPEDAAAILRTHNKETLNVFSTYVKTFTEKHITEQEHTLPFTRSSISSGTKDKTNGDLLPNLPSPQARSAFVALSGHGDSFTTIEDLCSSTRQGVFLESSVVPHLELYPDETKTPLNAYLFDFFKHGYVKPLEDANGIRKSDVWFILNDFSMILATICTSLALYLGLEDSDAEILDVMGAGDEVENANDERLAEDGIQTVSVSPPPSLKEQPKPVRGRKVVESWDAYEDKLAAEEDYLQEELDNDAGATDDEEYEKLKNVYRAFRKLKTEFDEKFTAIWA
ncbi:DEAD DEAH box helicase protein [Rutstroemia sp. NJR-2017a BVV2]|nr:DEAD DEAH box helicase protein [Rutstroemia sp. NJR-2017a BVV2]